MDTCTPISQKKHRDTKRHKEKEGERENEVCFDKEV